MKILFLSTLYPPNVVGGAERVLQSLAEALQGAGHETVVVSTAPEAGTRTDVVNGVRVHYVGLRNLYWPFRPEGRPGALKPVWHAIDTHNPLMASAAMRLIDQERPDLVHTHTLMGFSPAVWPQIRRRGLPIVHTLHDYYLLCPNATMFRDGRNCAEQHWDCRAYSLPRLRASRSVDAVVSVSRFVLERHLRHGAFQGVPRRHVIHNMYRPRQGTEARSGPVEDRPLRFGFIGQLSPIKGIELLLETAAGMPQDGWELLVAGKGLPAYTDALRDRYSSTPAVRFLGFARPEEFFDLIDVLILPSVWHEPLGTVVVEALVHGVPVIGSARGGTPDMVEHERNGLLFDPDRPEELRAAMERFLRRPELVEEMRPHCLKKARAFEPERILPQYEAVYTDVTAARERRF